MLKEKSGLASIKNLIGNVWSIETKPPKPPKQNNELYKPPTTQEFDRFYDFLGLETGKGKNEWQNNRHS